MPTFVVTWTIDIDADTPYEAARLARTAQMFGTEALTFQVFAASALDGPSTEIDLAANRTGNHTVHNGHHRPSTDQDHPTERTSA